MKKFAREYFKNKPGRMYKTLLVFFCAFQWVGCIFRNIYAHVTTQRLRRRTQSTHAHTRSLGVFVVGPAAHVAITESICLWHFALVLSSPTGEQTGFIARLVPGEPQRHTHTHTQFPWAISLSSIHIRILLQRCEFRHTEIDAKEVEGTPMDQPTECGRERNHNLWLLSGSTWHN